jgi:hypothetical protein
VGDDRRGVARPDEEHDAPLPGLLSDDAIAEYGIDLGKEIIYTRNGMLEAVTSSPRAMEGKRATATLKNETHHWLENNDGIAMSEVIARNLTKARGGDATGVGHLERAQPRRGLGRGVRFDAYLAGQTGRGADDFLYDSIEAPAGIDIEDPEQVRQGLIAARGDSSLAGPRPARRGDPEPATREGMARRFYFNQVVAGDDTWIARQAWDDLAAPREVAEQTPMRSVSTVRTRTTGLRCGARPRTATSSRRGSRTAS